MSTLADPPTPKSSTPYATADLEGVGGRIKQRPDDFLVEEQPLYLPADEGEHLYLFLEKTGATTPDVVRRLAKAFRVSRSAIGYAGRKDKHAVTRQHFSIHLPQPDSEQEQRGLDQLQHYPKVKLLWSARHHNKLRRGHHAGNRFVIRIRDVSPTSVVKAKPILERLAERGMPNYFGPQRFGFRANTHALGRLLLLGRYDLLIEEQLGRVQARENPELQNARAAYRAGRYQAALEAWPKSLRYDRQVLDSLAKGGSAKQAVLAMAQTQRRFMVTAFQSAVFNQILAQRVKEGTYDRLLAGDLAFKHESKAVFEVDQSTADEENAGGGRVEQLAVSPSGPMWGADMIRPQGALAQIELTALENHGLNVEDLQGHDDPPPTIAPAGTRRPLRVALRDPDLSGGVDEHGAYLRLAFELPKGAFATTALAEVMKNGGGDKGMEA